MRECGGESKAGKRFLVGPILIDIAHEAVQS